MAPEDDPRLPAEEAGEDDDGSRSKPTCRNEREKPPPRVIELDGQGGLERPRRIHRCAAPSTVGGCVVCDFLYYVRT